jgi:hypothetical protein
LSSDVIEVINIIGINTTTAVTTATIIITNKINITLATLSFSINIDTEIAKYRN